MNWEYLPAPSFQIPYVFFWSSISQLTPELGMQISYWLEKDLKEMRKYLPRKKSHFSFQDSSKTTPPNCIYGN